MKGSGAVFFVLLILSVMASNCPGCPRKPDSCSQGTRGCPCSPEGACSDSSLACEQGYCVPKDCERGAKGCGCYQDGTCDPLAGVPMTCDGNICTSTISPDPGALGGSCSDENPCKRHDGRKLDCISGMCELPGCPSGLLGCPCGPFGACQPLEGSKVRCCMGVCMLGGCEQGSSGCRCKNGEKCMAGFKCINGVCQSQVRRATLHIGNVDARACDVLIFEKESLVRSVVFSESVKGRHLHRSPKIGLSFIQRDNRNSSDFPFQSTRFFESTIWQRHHLSPDMASSFFQDENRSFFDSPVVLEIKERSASAGTGLRIESAECYDYLGRKLENPRVVLE